MTEVSYADLIAFAGAEALECTGGPRSLLQIGRQSSASPSEEGARAGFSWEAPTLDGVRAVGKASGLSAREMVALVGAVEALKIASRPPPPVAAEEDADLLAEDTTLEEMGLVVSSYAQNKNAAKVTDPNYYAKNKLAVDVRAPKLGATPFRQLVLPAGRRQEARAHAVRERAPRRQGDEVDRRGVRQVEAGLPRGRARRVRQGDRPRHQLRRARRGSSTARREVGRVWLARFCGSSNICRSRARPTLPPASPATGRAPLPSFRRARRARRG